MRSATLLIISLLSILQPTHAEPLGILPPPPIFGPHDPLNTLLKRLTPATRNSALTPSSTSWTNATLRNKPLTPPSLSLILSPSTTTEIEHIVKFANEYRIPVLPSVSTHGCTKSLTQIKKGIQLNLTPGFSSIKRIGKNEIEIGGGVRTKEVVDYLYENGLRATTPGCDCIGFIGPAFGGGTGTYEGHYGLIGDGITSVDIVTTKGKVKASAKENSDFFWGLIGAGHNFGVATSARVKVHPSDPKKDGNEWLYAFLSYKPTPEKILEVSRMLEKWRKNQPKEVSLFASFWHTAGDEGVPTFDIEIQSFGLPKLDDSLLAPFLKLGPVAESRTRLPWNMLAQESFIGVDGPGCAKNTINGRGTFASQIGTLHPKMIAETFTWWNTTVLPFARGIKAQTNLAWEVYPVNGVKAIREKSTAIAWRSKPITTMMQVAFGMEYKGTKTEKRIFELGEQGRKLLRVRDGKEKRVYVNYANGDESQEALYGERWRLERLRALKRKWDPRGVFSGYNLIRV